LVFDEFNGKIRYSCQGLHHNNLKLFEVKMGPELCLKSGVMKNGVRIIFLNVELCKKIILTPFFPPKNNSNYNFPYAG